MDHVLIYIIAFLAAGLALLSGFGLGTILTPVFLLFYEPKIAIFLLAVVHLLNNLLKLAIFRKHIDLGILKRFGILALIGALIGAFGQTYVANVWLKKLIGIVLIYLGFQEWFPEQSQFRLPKGVDPVGGGVYILFPPPREGRFYTRPKSLLISSRLRPFPFFISRSAFWIRFIRALSLIISRVSRIPS